MLKNLYETRPLLVYLPCIWLMDTSGCFIYLATQIHKQFVQQMTKLCLKSEKHEKQ